MKNYTFMRFCSFLILFFILNDIEASSISLEQDTETKFPVSSDNSTTLSGSSVPSSASITSVLALSSETDEFDLATYLLNQHEDKLNAETAH